jgi:hypothetical protein
MERRLLREPVFRSGILDRPAAQDGAARGLNVRATALFGVLFLTESFNPSRRGVPRGRLT